MVLDLVIVGAGPYGLSIAAHAKALGLNYELIGYPMEFWQKKMPPNMFIRTKLQYTGLSDPASRYTLNLYEKEKGIKLAYPLPRTTFVDYGFWFIHKTGIAVTQDWVTSISKEGTLFQILTKNGKIILSRAVVIAVGVTNAKHVPDNLSSLSNHLVSHSSDHTEFARFQGKRVIVLGGGQSAWEAAALLHQSKAEAILVYRRSTRLRASEGTNEKQQELADKFYFMRPEEKEVIRHELRKPTVSDFLVPLVEGKVLQRCNSFVKSARPTNYGQLEVMLNDNETMIVDHLIAATGFRSSVDRLEFLKPLFSAIERESEGSPKVNEHFQSTIAGLYFAGPITAYSHGPTYHFIAGVSYTAKTIVKNL